MSDDPARCGDTLREALQVRGPALIEAVVDLHEPPMPPKATMKQVAHLAEALAREISGRPARTYCRGQAEARSDPVRQMLRSKIMPLTCLRDFGPLIT
jgi:pyruvate dehydrogenase (quinone)